LSWSGCEEATDAGLAIVPGDLPVPGARDLVRFETVVEEGHLDGAFPAILASSEQALAAPPARGASVRGAEVATGGDENPVARVHP